MDFWLHILMILWAFSVVMWCYSLSQWIRFGPYHKRWDKEQTMKWTIYILGGALFMNILSMIMNMIK